MKAIRFHDYGSPEVLVLEEVPVPTIGPADVLVRVHAAAINPADWKFRAGWFREWVPLPLPFIPGADLAGTVVEAGPLATRFAPGDRVFAMRDVPVSGACAEYIAIPGDQLAHAPARLPLEHAAGAPLAALTAWSALFDVAQILPGQTVLVHAAAGGVGSFAVQLAKLAGARVIATASAGNAELVSSLGADEVIDYRRTDFTKLVAEIDVVIDALGGEAQAKSFGVLRRGGVLATLQPPGPDQELAQAHGVRAGVVAVSAHAARLEQIAALLDAGKLRVLIDRAFPLAETAAAHALSEAGHARGKIIVQVEQ